MSSGSVSSNEAAIKADAEAAAALVNRYGWKVGAAWRALAELDGVAAGAVRYLSGQAPYDTVGSYDDIVVARELREALGRAEEAVRGVKDAA